MFQKSTKIINISIFDKVANQAGKNAFKAREAYGEAYKRAIQKGIDLGQEKVAEVKARIGAQYDTIKQARDDYVIESQQKATQGNCLKLIT